MGFKASELNGAPKVLIAVGGAIVFLAIILGIGGFDYALKAAITSQMQIKNGTDLWNQWKLVPIPVYFRATIFNITNPEELANGAKAKLIEMGPYIYRETLYKDNITINEANNTIRYRQYKKYFFEPEMSDGKESDRVTFANIPFVAVAKMAHAFTDVDFILTKLDDMLSSKGERFTRTETVRDLLFDGFTIQPYIDLINDPMVQSAGEVKLPPQLENGRMGLLEGKNGSSEGWMEVHNGRVNSVDFGRMASFDYSPSVKVWKGAPCNKINGTDGMLFQPFIDKDKTVIQLFAVQACRTIWLEADKEMVTVNGVPAIRYRQPEKMYQSVINNPDNWCFCTLNSTCEINGFIDLGPCFGGAPMFLSQPHFLFADEQFRNNVEGLNPDPEKHWGYADLNPTLGVSLQTKHKMQFNLKVTQWESMPTFANLTTHFLPLMWMEEGATLEGKTLVAVKGLSAILVGWFFAKFGLGAFGGILLPGLAVAIVLKRRGQNSVKRLASTPSAVIAIKS